MRRVIFTVCTLFLAAAIARAAEPEPELNQLKCDVGPLKRTYGKVPWLVFSCNDNRSLVFKAAPESRAAPGYFMLYPKDNNYVLVGDGRGSKEAMDAAYAEIKAMSGLDINRLIERTKRAKK